MFSVSMVAMEVSTFVGLVEPEVPVIAAMANVNPALVAQITTGLEGLKAGAEALAQADDASSAGPIAQRIVADGNAVLQAASALPLPMSVSIPIRIAGFVFGFLPTIVAMLFPGTPIHVPSPVQTPPSGA